MKKYLWGLVAIGLALQSVGSVSADLLITEVSSTSSSSASYGADWFELTNTGASAINISGWKMDDNSNAFANAVALNTVTSIGAGESVVFVEGDSTTEAAFKTAWFGSNVPVGFQIGSYTGSGIGLSSGGDAVNIFDGGGALMARVGFGAGTTLVSFDNAAGLDGNVTLTTLSVVGTNGAFTSFSGGEVGSPGLINAIPEPGSLAFLGLAALALRIRRRR